MSSEFSLALARFVELYRHNPTEVSTFLKDRFSSENLEAEKDGNKSAETSIGKRTLINVSQAGSFLRCLRDAYPAIEAEERSYESWCHLFESLQPGILQKLAKSMADQDPRFDSDLDVLSRTPENPLFFLFCEAEKNQNNERGKPDYHIAMARRFASELDTIVEKLNGLENLGCSEIVSDAVRTLLREAHYCFLHGLEVASAIMCGTALEETLKQVVLDRDDNWDLFQLLQKARNSSLLSEEEWGMADDVREFRNLATHNPQEFSRRSQIQKISLLSNTRAVVEILLQKNEKIT